MPIARQLFANGATAAQNCRSATKRTAGHSRGGRLSVQGAYPVSGRACGPGLRPGFVGPRPLGQPTNSRDKALWNHPLSTRQSRCKRMRDVEVPEHGREGIVGLQSPESGFPLRDRMLHQDWQRLRCEALQLEGRRGTCFAPKCARTGKGRPGSGQEKFRKTSPRLRRPQRDDKRPKFEESCSSRGLPNVIQPGHEFIGVNLGLTFCRKGM